MGSLVFMDTKLELLGELLVELLVVLSVLLDVGEHLEASLDDVLLDDLEDLVLLEGLTRDVKRHVFGIDNTLNKGEALGDELVTIVHDENTTDVKFDVVLLLLGFELIEGSAFGDEEEGSELEGSFNGEVLDGEVFLPVVGEGFVESSVLVFGDVLGRSNPDWLDLVEGLPLVGNFLNFLGLVLLDLLNLRLILVLLTLGLLLSLGLFLIGVSDFLLGGFLTHELNGESNELGVLLDEILQSSFFEVLRHIFLEGKGDSGSTRDLLLVGGDDGEGTSSVGFPKVFNVFVRLGDDGDLLGDEISGVETNTELTNHTDIGTSRDGFHEGLGSRLGNCSEVTDEVGLGHTNTGILDGEGVVGLVGNDSNTELRLSLKLLGLGNTLVSDFIKSIGRVRDEFSKEDLLVGVESVDDKGHQLLDISAESKYFFGHLLFIFL